MPALAWPRLSTGPREWLAAGGRLCGAVSAAGSARRACRAGRGAIHLGDLKWRQPCYGSYLAC